MELHRYTIGLEATFDTALREMDRRGTQILLVVGNESRLCGTITDGDLRRAILRKLGQGVSVAEVMNPHPIKVTDGCTEQQARDLMQANSIHHLPIVDQFGCLRGLFTEDNIFGAEPLGLRAVLMVGGYGKRLGELTDSCPKPMLKIGGRPILHTIVEQLRAAGINQIFMAVNYLASQIKDYFGNGDGFGVSISYLEEEEPVGTAGALRLLSIEDDLPILVMNGDILTRVNFAHLYRFHKESRAIGTMCVREFVHQVPYGVVQLSGTEILCIEEKPASRCFINSGIYILDSCALHYVPGEGVFNMPTLFDALREQHKKTVAYPIYEYWADVGTPQEFKAADESFARCFG